MKTHNASPSHEESFTILRTSLTSLNLPVDLIDELIDRHIAVSFEKGATAFREGNTDGMLAFILSGYVSIYCPVGDGDRTLVRLAGPGEMVGYADYVDEKGRHARLFEAQAATKCTIALFSRDHLAQLLAILPSETLVSLISSLNTFWSENLRFFTTFLNLPFWDRLTIVLGDLARRAGVKDSLGTILIPEIVHEELAEMIGCSRPMVSRLIAQMIDSGLLARRGKKYVLLKKWHLSMNGNEFGKRVRRYDLLSRRASSTFSAPTGSGNGVTAFAARGLGWEKGKALARFVASQLVKRSRPRPVQGTKKKSAAGENTGEIPLAWQYVGLRGKCIRLFRCADAWQLFFANTDKVVLCLLKTRVGRIDDGARRGWACAGEVIMEVLPEYVDGPPNICGSEQAVEGVLRGNQDQSVFLRESRIDFGRIRSASAIALHMHQPLIPAGGPELPTASIISNLKHMMDNPSIGDNRNALCFRRWAGSRHHCARYFEARALREAEILVLRQQRLILSWKAPKRARLRKIDRLILVWLSRLFPSVLDAIVIVKPETDTFGFSFEYGQLGSSNVRLLRGLCFWGCVLRVIRRQPQIESRSVNSPAAAYPESGESAAIDHPIDCRRVHAQYFGNFTYGEKIIEIRPLCLRTFHQFTSDAVDTPEFSCAVIRTPS
jgi:CRP-like cAMP-binding protein